MTRIVGDRVKSGQRPPGAFCLSLLHHARIGTVQSIYSQRVQNEPFLTTRVENQTVPGILVATSETFKYYSLLMNSTKIVFVRSNFGQLVGNVFQMSSKFSTNPVVRKSSSGEKCSI
jgi:hypothetical protein